jgi:hypothetical protein
MTAGPESGTNASHGAFGCWEDRDPRFVNLQPAEFFFLPAAEIDYSYSCF